MQGTRKASGKTLGKSFLSSSLARPNLNWVGVVLSKFVAKLTVGIVLGTSIALSGAVAAGAAGLYEDINYSGFMENRTSGTVGAGFNDKTSSVTNSGTETYCENVGCSGRKVTLTGSYNNLHSVVIGLGFGESWGDRISALQ